MIQSKERTNASVFLHDKQCTRCAKIKAYRFSSPCSSFVAFLVDPSLIKRFWLIHLLYMIFKLQGIFKKHRTAVSCGDCIMNLNKPFKSRCSSSRGRSEGWSGISHKIFRCPVDFHSKFKCSQTECIEVIEDFTVSRIFISNLFCVVLVNMIPFPRTAGNT